ncbi:MAG: bifunctional metallophosphatase/5'-nucleotidase [Polyangiaceae bacterium]|nr:bifunctional metallophosphatase/5'-nucleotidase [Polyangiaceae bacterium]
MKNFLLASAFVLACGMASCSSNESPIASACPPNTPCSVRLTILHTSDIHSRLLSFDQVITQVDSDLGLGSLNSVANVGGVARMAYILGRERARSDRALHLDSGDCFQGAPIFNFFAGEPEVRALSAMGTDAAVIGNHEFDRGPTNVAIQMQKWANFPVLAANYKWEDVSLPNYAQLATVARPFTVFNQEGLKVAVIGMANLSSLSSVYDQPNKLSITPLNTVDVAQFYVDLLRPYVDVVIMLTHLGLDVDQRMVRGTTGIDLVLGGHNHVVINPPQELRDCSADPQNPGFIWAADPNNRPDPGGSPPDDPEPELKGPAGKFDPQFHPWQFKRPCTPRKVTIAHSGSFSKYVGRLDLILSNDPKDATPTGAEKDYDALNKFEIISSRYTAFPIDASVPEDPVVQEMLLPYRRGLDIVADLNILAGYSPDGARRISSTGGDSPLGNIVATGMWLRNGIQTDFSLTNSTGIRADLLPGVITTEQMYNIFPFDNSISKMQLSGLEVQQLFDYVARRSASRGCTSQIQIAGARVRMNCAGCTRENAKGPCMRDEDCRFGGTGSCVFAEGANVGQCTLSACADQVYIGSGNKQCGSDTDCADNGVVNPGSCDPNTKRCQALINDTNRYELATSNYLAGGGSGFRVLQRNTTQFDTKIQQRDALIDYIRQGRACGYKDPTGDATRDPANGLKLCAADADCKSEGDFVCACNANTEASRTGDATVCNTVSECGPGQGRCVRRDCRNAVATFHDRDCAQNPNREGCRLVLNACSSAGEECKILACVDKSIGNFSDGRLEMIGR